MGVTIQKESMSEILEEGLPLISRNWEEMGMNKDFLVLDPAYKKYKKLDAFGSLKLFTVRSDGKLVGYVLYTIFNHPHFQTSLWAQSDTMWLSPDQRGLGHGAELVTFAEDWLRNRGVVIMRTGVNLSSKSAGIMLEKLGHFPVEMAYEKVLRR